MGGGVTLTRLSAARGRESTLQWSDPDRHVDRNVGRLRPAPMGSAKSAAYSTASSMSHLATRSSTDSLVMAQDWPLA